MDNNNDSPYSIDQPVAAPPPLVGHPENTPGVIVLQWLTYAFWGWTVLVASVLLSAIMSNLLQGTETGDFTTYALAAILVLLPISVVCDYFYSKSEPSKKYGAAMVVMVIHVVLFALIGIGSLITAVFAVVQMLTQGNEATWGQVTLFSSLSIAVLYAATFLRTLNPIQLPWVSKMYKVFMVVAILIITILCIVGPIRYEYTTKNDKLITANINSIESAISGYTVRNNRLPENLKQLNLSGDAKLLIEKNLVKYTSGERNSRDSTRNSRSSSSYSYDYTLCVTFAKADKSSDGYSDEYDSANYELDDSDNASTYINTEGHPAGEVCYKLKTDNDYSYDASSTPID